MHPNIHYKDLWVTRIRFCTSREWRDKKIFWQIMYISATREFFGRYFSWIRKIIVSLKRKYKNKLCCYYLERPGWLWRRWTSKHLEPHHVERTTENANTWILTTLSLNFQTKFLLQFWKRQKWQVKRKKNPKMKKWKSQKNQKQQKVTTWKNQNKKTWKRENVKTWKQEKIQKWKE